MPPGVIYGANFFVKGIFQKKLYAGDYIIGIKIKV
jgi:hypothetical protein